MYLSCKRKTNNGEKSTKLSMSSQYYEFLPEASFCSGQQSVKNLMIDPNSEDHCRWVFTPKWDIFIEFISLPPSPAMAQETAGAEMERILGVSSSTVQYCLLGMAQLLHTQIHSNSSQTYTTWSKEPKFQLRPRKSSLGSTLNWGAVGSLGEKEAFFLGIWSRINCPCSRGEPHTHTYRGSIN